MSKAVLLSIRPEHGRNLIDGKKSVELRKNWPLKKTPFLCYLYCTMGGEILPVGENALPANGMVFGQAVCYDIYRAVEYREDNYLVTYPKIISRACVTEEEAIRYAKGNSVYGWYLRDLEIYNKPRKLDEFRPFCSPRHDCECCEFWSKKWMDCMKRLTRAPQSWCYVEGE